MKRLVSFLWMLVILPALFINSCEKLIETEQEGILELAVLVDQQGGLKSALDDSSAFTSHFLIISVVNGNGEMIMADERIELYNFGGHWITKDIKLKVGAYELVKFLVVDPDGNVIYAAPVQGSPKAYLVSHPLPLPFGITKDQVTRVVPEVLAVIEEPPEAFGYVSFSYSVVVPLNFFIAIYINNPLTMSPVLYTNAKLTVMVDSLWMHIFKLEPRINKVTIRDGFRYYLLIIEKEGFEPVKLQLPREELAKSTPEEPLLIGMPSDSLHLLVLQPGPKKGKDAMISKSLPEENFGDYPFFEAIAIQPWRSDIQNQLTRSLIEWDLNQLPESATIRKAVMTLYYAENYLIDTMWIRDTVIYIAPSETDPPEIPPYEIKEAAVLQRVISSWEEQEVTWMNQPETTDENQVVIPKKYYILDANCATCIVPPVCEIVDVTALITDMAESGYHGMMMKLIKEEYLLGFRFASSDFKSPGLWPLLEIYYTLPL